MGEPDFTAFGLYLDSERNSDSFILRIPMTNPDVPGKSYVMINTSSLYRAQNSETRPTQEQQARMEEAQQVILEQIIRARSGNLNPDDPLIVQMYEMLKGNQGVFQALRDRSSDPQSMHDSGGGASNGNLDIIMRDPAISNLEDTIGRAIGRPVITSAQDEELFDEYVMNHEAAHNILGLKEAGADFMAAAIMMRENRNAGNMLGMVADARTLSFFGDMHVEPGKEGSQHGVVCSDAIQYALAINPDELQNMSLEDLYTIAQRFDQQTMDNALSNTDPENAVLDVWEQYLPGEPRTQDFVMNDGTTRTVRIAPPGFIPENFENRFPGIELPEGSAADKLRDNMVDAFNRLSSMLSPSDPEAEANEERPRTARPAYTQTPTF